MGVCGSKPVTPASTKVHLDAGGGVNGATCTPVEVFDGTHDSSLLLPDTGAVSSGPAGASQPAGGGGGGLAARLFKRGANQQGGQAQVQPDGLPGVLGRPSIGASPASHGAQQASAAATAAAAAAAAAATGAAAAGGGAAGAGAGGGAVGVGRGLAGVAPRSDGAAQTDASLLYPLLRDPGPTVPVRWRKGEGIGAGSFGQVFLALNCDTGELLAVKEVPAGLMEAGAAAAGGGGAQAGGGGVGGGGGGARSTAAEAVAQLEREVALLSSLRHPNIVRYVGTARDPSGGGAGAGGAPLYIFLEYVPGGSLSSQLARFGPLPEPLVGLYTRQLLLGLAYLHAQRTVHRDVKGANILLEKTGVLKLADFGMAKQLMEQVSFTRSFKGSAYWMAPEVIKQQGYGVQADIWSVGCTVLEMATGKPPWSQCTSQVQAIFKIASSQDLPAIPDHLSPQASEFILLCLQRDPSARPTAEELLRHPFVTAPLSRTPLPPALADPLSYLTAYDSSAASAAGAAAGGLRPTSSIGGAAGAALGSLAGVAAGLAPLRLGLAGGRGSAANTPTAAAAAAGGGGWPQYGGLVSGSATAAAAAAAAASGAVSSPAAAGQAGGGSPFAMVVNPLAGFGSSVGVGPAGMGGVHGLGTMGGAGVGGPGAGMGVGVGGVLGMGGAGGGGGAMDEDQLAALVLGNSVHISKAARTAQAIAAEEEREEEDLQVDFTTQPQHFRVRGLLTLPPLKTLQGSQLPALGVQQEVLRNPSWGGLGAQGRQGGGGGGGVGAGGGGGGGGGGVMGIGR